MKKLRKLPILLAFAVIIFASSCGDDTAIVPIQTDEDRVPPPPPPPGPNAVYSDTTTFTLG